MSSDHSAERTAALGPTPRSEGAHALARGLGYFSVALGLVQLVWPRHVAHLAELGERPHGPELPRSETILRAQGVRELVVGTGLLTAAEREPWLWVRVAGDAIDMATLTLATRRQGMADRTRGSRGGALLVLAAVAVLDVFGAQALRRDRQDRERRSHDWSRRSGFPQRADAMRGEASDFAPDDDMRTPQLLRPWVRR